MGNLQIQQKPEAIEVSLDIIVARVPFLKRQLSGELGLGRRLKPDWDDRNPDLRTLRVKIATETLEVGAEMQYEASQGLVEKRRIRRSEGQDGGAVRFYLVQPRHTIILPAGNSRGRQKGIIAHWKQKEGSRSSSERLPSFCEAFLFPRQFT
jgi:hypothetical protein